jgi:hypothetical protein
VENHVDELACRVPAHHGWLSDIGSDFDPETTLPICDDGSQPVEDEYSQVLWFNKDVEAEEELDTNV